MKVLLFEDREDAAATIKTALQERGFEVAIYVGVNQIHDEHLLALRSDLTNYPLYPAQYDYAFVDGALLGRFHDGFAIVPELVKHGVVCCGISNGKMSNEDMVAVGAVAACFKGDVIAKLDELLAQMSTHLPQGV